MLHGTHLESIAVGYAAAIGGWLLIRQTAPKLWPTHPPQTFARPWREAGLALVAVILLIGLGVLYSHDIRLPTHGRMGPVLEAVNQLIIFSPMILLLIVRRQSLASAWLPTDHVPARLAVGVVLAILAIVAFSLIRAGALPWWQILSRLPHAASFPYAVQVFLEDFTIAVILVRFSALLRRPFIMALIVGALFALAHIPAMLTEGIRLQSMGFLLGDFVLAACLLLVLQRSRDIWWLCCVHFAMDMTQFAAVSGVAMDS